jgi:hypothetical protein
MTHLSRRPVRTAPTRKITSSLAVGVALAALSAANAGATTAPTFTVVIDSLLCHTTEDNSGPDEPFLLGNNVRIWGNGSLNNEESANVNATFDGQGTASIKLYDADLGSWPDYHDFLGEVVVNADQVDQGSQTGTFTKDGASYEVYYHVNSR